MAEMTFWDHLDELRRVLFRVIGVWFVLAIGYFVAMPYLFDHVTQIGRASCRERVYVQV